MAKAGTYMIDTLSEQLKLKQLELDTLLNITNAINNNAPASELFELFSHTLVNQLGVERMLLVRYENEWAIQAKAGYSNGLKPDVETDLLPIRQLTFTEELADPKPAILSAFDIVIPVYHKDRPLAYLLISNPQVANLEKVEDKIKFAQTVTNIILVAIENKRLFNREKEQEVLQRELELAAQVQSMLIPDRLPSNDFVDVDAIYMPHTNVGGDYYDFLYLNDEEFFFCIADISGKGMSAALLMANFQGQLRELVKKNHPTIDEFLQELNSGVLHNTRGEKFITMFLGKYNTRTRVLKYVNAGHNPPVLINSKGNRLLDLGCTILGIFDELPQVRMGQIPIVEDTTIMCYTDGLTDQVDMNGQPFSTEDITSLLEENLGEDVSAINHVLGNRIMQYRNGQSFTDDITIMTVRIFGRN
ncbi:MAG: PP2C family protein-serine/threonine phosphatase [Chitinophagales bacterium]|nr:PP2C family protein-serine/threonine phosphatase [Chitinophagales bacterium]